MAYIETREDIDWLFSTHLKGRDDSLKSWNCKAAILEGNEDCPTEIKLFYVAPKRTSVPRHVLTLQEDGSYKRKR